MALILLGGVLALTGAANGNKVLFTDNPSLDSQVVELPERLRVPRGQEGWLGDAPIAISVNIVAQAPEVAEGATVPTGAHLDVRQPDAGESVISDVSVRVVEVRETDIISRFIEGYRAFNGEPGWEAHFVNDVLPCESSDWGGWYANGYVSRAQFAVGSWATASGATGLVDPTDPYAVGANVAWWSNVIGHPGSRSGWPSCWWTGNIP